MACAEMEIIGDNNEPDEEKKVTEDPSVTSTVYMRSEEGAVGGQDPSFRGSGGGGTSVGCDEKRKQRDEIKEMVVNKITELENRLQLTTDIPEFLFDVHLECLKESTKHSLMLFLDPEMSIEAEEGYCKDYRGVAEWLNLDPAFCRYIAKIDLKNKFNEVLSMWMKEGGSKDGDVPQPIVKNLRQCLLEIDRPDALETLAAPITRDAMTWKKAMIEANTTEIPKPDTSWQLTRHDEVTKKKTYYTCCLVFADEDLGMARVIINMFRHVHPDTLFFLPQFDLIKGKYENEATADVIINRCNGKVIFVISEFFAASPVCKFTAKFCKEYDMESNEGNLIPFILTKNEELIPHVLRGIQGIKWHNRLMREHYLNILVETILAQTLNSDTLEAAKRTLDDILRDHPTDYICDPPYASNTPSPSTPYVFLPEPEPDQVAPNTAIQPVTDIDNSEMEPIVDQEGPSGHRSTECSRTMRTRSRLERMRNYVRKKIMNKVFSPKT